MAADAVVSAVVRTALGILSSASLQEIGLLWGFKDDLNRLVSTFGTIQRVLQDAEIKHRKSEATQNWLWKLKNVAYDAENILDRIATHGLRRRVNSQRGMQHELKSFLSLRNPLLFRFKMVHQMRNIRAKLDAIANERHDYHLMEGVVENRFGETLESRQTCSPVNESEIVGRDGEKEKIIGKLLDGSCDQQDLSVHAIWGMGGLGKTTLAQMVYNDERTEKHFDLRIWVCVSDDFSIQRLVRAIIESLEGSGCNISELDPLQHHLQEKLRGRRFLLVLDDVWDDKHSVWDKLKEVLRCGSKGSVLVVTTRIQKVVLMMATSTVHDIGCLSEDDSWSLFSQRAFPTGKEEENLAAIGKEIVKKCGGVPLAIKALGSLMRTKSHENEWLAVKESEMWHLSDNANDILPALRLSYYNLLPQMRQCFAFCCIFPKDYVMEKNMLIQLWMANGYLHSDGQKDLYHTGQLIFKELVWGSFLQDARINSRGDMTCKMHDLMHDLALSIMRHEAYILEHGKELNIPKTLRHLCFCSTSYYNKDFDNNSKLKLPINDSLCSIFVVGDGRVPAWREALSSVLPRQQYLRVLQMDFYMRGKYLPKFFFKFEQLRYLVLSCYQIKRLPESLTHLINLQTLKLTNSYNLLELPKGLRVMKNLWFLEMDNFDSLVCTPPGLGELTCLRKLSVFIVGEDASYQIEQLKNLNLEGELSIQGLDNVRNLEGAKRANLMTKKNLTSLILPWKKGIIKNSAEDFDEVLEGLQPHQNLEKISIKSYQGSRFPHWISSPAFAKLKDIILEDCQRCEHLPPFGNLPSLTYLKFSRMDSVKCLNAEFHGDGESPFPLLISLTISKMPNLEEWTTTEDSLGSFPCLENLDIDLCPKLTGVPKLPTLRTLQIASSCVELVRSITDQTSLRSLSLYDFPELDVFPEGLLQNHEALENIYIFSLPIRTLPNMFGNLSALRSLTLDRCSNLEFLSEGLKHLNSLETLNIFICDSLRSFPATILESLPSLRSLSLDNCTMLKPFSGLLNQAPGLHDLQLNGLPKLECLPESMQLLSALRELRISNCRGLSSLPNWLGRLESLSTITIDCCMFNSLPDAFKTLKSLRELHINGSLIELERRCMKPNGEDWPKISHIPLIYINFKTIQCLDQ